MPTATGAADAQNPNFFKTSSVQLRLSELLELVSKFLNILRLKLTECEFLWRNMFSVCATNASGKSGDENEAREGLTHGAFRGMSA